MTDTQKPSDEGQKETAFNDHYIAGRYFLKKGKKEKNIFIHLKWSGGSADSGDPVDLFVKEGNRAKDAEKPLWLTNWPMNCNSLRQNIVDALKRQGGGIN